MTDVSVSSRTAIESPLTERQWVRRGELLQAARQVFERDGYHGTTVSAVVQAAGLSQGAFYLYFADKKGIFAALQDEMATLLRRRIYWVTRDEPDAGRRLEAGLRAYFEFYDEYPAYSRRLTIDFETPSRRAAGETPPASATSTKVRRSSISIIGVPLSATQLGRSRGYRIAVRNDTMNPIRADNAARIQALTAC